MNLYSIFSPLIRLLDPELAHNFALTALKFGWVVETNWISDPILKTQLWGLNFRNPIGLAAGFDKNCEVPNQMLRYGFGFVEVGTVTPEPQFGNQRPRVFRLNKDRAVINRLGFNNKGSKVVEKNLLKARKKNLGVIGVNIGKNKSNINPIEDYTECFDYFADLGDYIVINVSSPNTPGLRSLQKEQSLTSLIKAIRRRRLNFNKALRTPILVKVSPDLSSEETTKLAEVFLKNRVDGIIATNTTISRPNGLKSEHKFETGGLSGQPLFDLSTSIVSDFFRLTGGKIPIIGVGGVSSGIQAYKKIRAGASLVQIYSSLIFKGPKVVKQINTELATYLRQDGFQNLTEAVGVDVT